LSDIMPVSEPEKYPEMTSSNIRRENKTPVDMSSKKLFP